MDRSADAIHPVMNDVFISATAVDREQSVRRMFLSRRMRALREYGEVLGVISGVTVIAWFVPLDYRVFGDVYLLAVIALCLRVGRWPILFAAVISVLAWNIAIVPPRLSFSRLDLKDGVFLGTYFVAALLAGQLTARIRAQERRERQREQRATALFHLTRALSSAQTLDEAVTAALQQADSLFDGHTALLLANEGQPLTSHSASSLVLDPVEYARAGHVLSGDVQSTSETAPAHASRTMHIPLVRSGAVLGVFSLRRRTSYSQVTTEQRELIETFAAQIGLLLERERLRAASEREKLLAESDRLHRTLLDSVSHELRTPIAVLRSAAENLATQNASRRETLADEVRTATDRLDRLVGNLLNQTRLEAGGLSPHLDWCDARDILGGARRSVGAPLAQRALTIEIPPDMPLFMADFVLMEQAVSNLLVNAVLHTPIDTPIKIVTGTDSVSERVFIAVIDHGPGIAPEYREKLFQKFQRGATARPGGLGLGLSIVRGFMLAQGGEVSIDGNPDGGARFTLYLPAASHENVPHE